jgi:hypothetical protein
MRHIGTENVTDREFYSLSYLCSGRRGESRGRQREEIKTIGRVERPERWRAHRRIGRQRR